MSQQTEVTNPNHSTSDVVAYLVTWSERDLEYESSDFEAAFANYIHKDSAVYRVKRILGNSNKYHLYKHIHLYESVNGVLTEIELSEATDVG